MKGEVFFEVECKFVIKVKFIVIIEDLEVEVLGIVFNVNIWGD